MKIVGTPSYADFFDDKPEFTALIAGIPTKFILGYCSLINAELFNRRHDLATQAKLFGQFTGKFPQDLKERLVNRMNQLYNHYYQQNPNQPFTFFTKKFTFELIHRALLHPDISDQPEPTPEQDLRIFKAYLLCNDEHSEQAEQKVSSSIDATSARLRFRTFTWSFFVQQAEINHDLSAPFQSIILSAFIAFLDQTDPYKKYLPQYLSHVQHTSPANYLLEIVKYVQHSIKKEDATTNNRFSFIKPDKPSTLLQHLSLNNADNKNQPHNHKNYKGLKDKPLLEFTPNVYFAFSYGLFVHKIYNGFVFDFYKYSGIKKEKGFTTFADYKTNYSKQFVEEKVFRTIIKETFPHKYTTIAFSSADGAPDCYIRIGSTILLIEFKDYLFPDNIAIEGSYELIKEHIDTKFISNKNGKPKGVNQIINQLNSLEKECFSFDNFTDKKIKKRNITVYPIIVHTNRIYGMPDINDYLNDHFRSNLPTLSYKAKDIILIELETIYLFLQTFQQDKKAFINMLDNYLIRKKKKQKQFNAQSDIDQFNGAYPSIESVIPYLDMQQNKLRLPEFTKEIFNSMNIEFRE